MARKRVGRHVPCTPAPYFELGPSAATGLRSGTRPSPAERARARGRKRERGCERRRERRFLDLDLDLVSPLFGVVVSRTPVRPERSAAAGGAKSKGMSDGRLVPGAGRGG